MALTRSIAASTNKPFSIVPPEAALVCVVIPAARRGRCSPTAAWPSTRSSHPAGRPTTASRCGGRETLVAHNSWFQPRPCNPSRSRIRRRIGLRRCWRSASEVVPVRSSWSAPKPSPMTCRGRRSARAAGSVRRHSDPLLIPRGRVRSPAGSVSPPCVVTELTIPLKLQLALRVDLNAPALCTSVSAKQLWKRKRGAARLPRSWSGSWATA